MAKRNWVVNVSTDINDPAVYGPYTERRAEELAASFNEKIDKDNFGFVFASAYPIQNLGIRAMLADFGQ